MKARRLGKFLIALGTKLGGEAEDDKRKHPVVEHSGKPTIDDVPQVGDITTPQAPSGGHHFHDTTPGRWGGPYL